MAMNVVEHFFERVERQRAEDLLPRAARPLDRAGHIAAIGRARVAAQNAGLGRTIREAPRTVDDWVIRLYNGSHVSPGWLEANWGHPGTIEDPANLARSLGEAVSALILGDRLDAADRDELLGAWADLVPDA
jgi:hypothetical protein